MQQKIILGAILASGAVAVPWGPGGRWGTAAPAQASGSPSANPWGPGGPGGQGGVAVVTDVAMATVVDTVISQPTVTDWVHNGGNGAHVSGNGGSNGSVSALPTPTAVATPPAAPSSGDDGDSDNGDDSDSTPSSTLAAHGQVATHSAHGAGASISPAVSDTPAAKGQSKPSSPTSSVAQPDKTTPAAKPSATSTGTSSSSSSGTGASTDYQKQVLDSHNVHRANHSANALNWDAGLAATAQKIAASCKFAHDTKMDGGGYGQNIQAGTAENSVWEAITNSFYNGEVNAYTGQYGLANPGGDFESYGHFTQVVWADTTSVGCATVHCPNGVQDGAGTKDFTVCNYKPPGNFGGQYAKNVAKSLNKPTVDTNVAAGSY